MSISNLHSLLNKPWYIEENYGAAQLPLIFNILSGNTKVKEAEKDTIVSFSDSLYSGPSTTQKETRVAILSIKNPITKHDQYCGPQGTKSMMRQLDLLKDDETVTGVVLDIDSGGGQAYGTPEFYDYLVNYSKPIVSYTDGLMCSAAYYIGSGADYIIANKRAEAIGSIGAYTKILDLSGYYEKQGAKLHTIYATKSTEKNKAYRDALAGEDGYDSYRKLELDPLVETFHTDMRATRANLSDEVFKGGTWSGEKALEKGLVDAIGTLQDAIYKVNELSTEKNNTNTTKMSKSYPQIEASIGKTFGAGEASNGILLTETEADAVEKVISDKESEITTALTAKTTAETALQAAENKEVGIVAKVNDVLELTGDNKVTSVEDAVTALIQKNEELGAAPGADHTNLGSKSEDESSMPSYVDTECSIYKVK